MFDIKLNSIELKLMHIDSKILLSGNSRLTEMNRKEYCRSKAH